MSRSDRLQEALQAQKPKMSMAALARATGLKDVTVRTYFSGTREPPLEECEAMGTVLGYRGKWLRNGTGPKLLSAKEPVRSPTGLIEVPLIDQVAAGRLTAPTSQIPIEDVPLLAFADLGPGEFFATKVNGTSMDRISPDGSTIVVNKRDRQLVTGRCYVFAVGGETTYKRWQGGDPSYLEPHSFDTIHKPIFVKKRRDFEVIGRVKRTVLDL